MTSFIGEYTCKLDSKNRVLFPAALKKQFPATMQDKFVLKKDIFEECLVLYTLEEWKRQNEILREKLNPYNKKHNQFLRGFYRGAAEVLLDSNNRMLLPKRLSEKTSINKEIVMIGQDKKIEIWAAELYESSQMHEDEFAALAEQILGGNNDN